MSARRVLITGAAGCIGRALCESFLEAGDEVVALDIDPDALAALRDDPPSREGALVTVVTDVVDPPTVRRAIDQISAEGGHVSVLVNNAGGNRTTLLSETTAEDWRADIELNLNAAFYVCSAVIPGMLESGAGCIVNIGSVNGLGTFGDPGYSAAKAGLISYTRSLATEFGRRGIRANVVCPGTVKTRAWDEMLASRQDLFSQLTELCSLGEIATPEDVAAAVRFLASAEARAIHGSTLVVDGGLTAGIPSVMSAFTSEDIPGDVAPSGGAHAGEPSRHRTIPL